ncbi:hypothetical protein [Marinobacter sp. X15-166B]|uniref:DUF7946 domain-containing protein n=1 Tax=Marinobacter sp. X15-166B TaxID=1897620 RepID=UPI00085CD9AA|nr:hypothetical protein [Marinobacter sp. X15-166B]OEY66821.1 hypothetical protein BG841_10385 [Marinobacter sp. X15-166B]
MAARTVNLSISYDGKAHEQHEIEISELATSLKGLGELVQVSNKLINGIDSPIEIKVTGFEPGSFEYLVEIAQVAAQYKDVLPYIGLAGGTVAAGSLLEILKKLRGRKIDLVEELEGSETVVLHVDGEEVECSKEVDQLLASKAVRAAVQDLIYNPTRKEGTETFKIKDKNGKVLLQESKNGASNYKAPGALYAERKNSEDVEAQVKFLTAHADKSNQWRIEYLGQAHNVKIKDDLFLELIHSQESPTLFGQKYKVKLEKVVKEARGRDPITSYVIQKVYHKSLK